MNHILHDSSVRCYLVTLFQMNIFLIFLIVEIHSIHCHLGTIPILESGNPSQEKRLQIHHLIYIFFVNECFLRVTGANPENVDLCENKVKGVGCHGIIY